MPRILFTDLLSGRTLLCCLLAAGFVLCGCAEDGAQYWREYKLFCGMSSPYGEVSEAEWQRFCDDYVTQAFPDGFTSFEATGYWKGDASTTKKEKSHVLLILSQSDAKDQVFALARQYCKMFNQDAVLVVASSGAAIFVGVR